MKGDAMRNRHVPLLALAFFLLLPGAVASALTVGLSQLDASRLLLTQEVDAYVSVTDPDGRPVEGLGRDAFSVFESADGSRFGRIDRITSFQPRAGARNGITFLLLIDDSGSMYDALDGTPTKDPARMRITHAKEAVRTFLSRMTNPADRVGLASFNTLYTGLSEPAADRERIAGLLEKIGKPAPEEAYTELYGSLALAARALAKVRGRKAVVVLSDGENYPFTLVSGKDHPVFARHLFSYEEPILASQEEAVTVYGINFGHGDEKDRNLRAIARETGGTVFDAQNRDELEGVYEAIHRQVAGEYLLTYRATLAPAEKKFVRVEVSQGGESEDATRFYFSETVLGLPPGGLTPLLLIPLLLAAFLLWLLTALKLERKRGPASLEVIQTRVGHPATRMVRLEEKTVIGGSPKANLTIVGAPQVREQHATILFDPGDESYTVVGSADILVNNRPVRTRKLETGDVIDVGGATIVFDDEGGGKKKG
jgi:Ca-activated chloride channel homolog